MNEQSFRVPLPVSVNQIYQRGKNGATFLSPAAKAYKSNVGWTARACGIEMMKGRLEVEIWVYRRIKRGDLDNNLKLLLDSLNGIAWEDDEQITDILAHRRDNPNDPHVLITIRSAV